MDMCVSKLQELVMYWEAWRAVIYGVTKKLDTTERLNWLNYYALVDVFFTYI